jgi:predicted permease
MSGGRSAGERLYRFLAGCLPRAARRDRDEMARLLGELRAEAPGRSGRWWRTVRGVAALLRVLLVEWLEVAGGVRAADGNHRQGQRRGGMDLVRSLRLATRTLRKAPAFSATAVLLVGVGVGAVTTIFTVVDHVLLRPLPYPAAERLVGLRNGSFQGPYVRELEEFGTVEEWGAAWSDRVNLVDEGEPLHVEQARVSERFLELFGARAQLGRLLTPDDFRTAAAVVLDAGTWHRVWGGDPSVVGRTLQVDGESVTVVGVLEPSFAPPEALVGRSVDVWRPLDWSSDRLNSHTAMMLQVAGRRAPGAALEAVQAELDALDVRMAEVHENYRNRDGTPRHIPVEDLAEMTVQRVRTALGLLLGAVSLLLLVACANVANLFLARGLGRTREMAVRRALGASSARVAGQLLGESLVVGMGGGALGIALAWLGIRAFVALNPTALPRQAAVAVDPKVIAFAVAVSVLTSVVFGLLPALRSVRGELADELRSAGRSATAGRGLALLRSSLVGGEIALSLVLVAGAGLLLRSFLTVRAQEPGFEVEDVWTVPLTIPEPESPAEYLRFMDAVLREVEALPGVRSAAYGLTMPLQWTGGSTCCWSTRVEVPGREEDDALRTMIQPVSPDYFETLGVVLVAGRSWSAAEAEAEPVPVVVSARLARELAGSITAAVGSRIGFYPLPSEVVVAGVAADSRHYGLDGEIRNQLYMPAARLPFPIPIGTVAARVESGAGAAMAGSLRAAVRAAAPDVPVAAVLPMRDVLDASTAGRRFESLIFGTFATLALLLAAGGLYGTLLYLAGQRRRELGIRIALGASRGQIEARVMAAGLMVGVIGVLVGLVASWMSNRLLESRVWGVERGDPVALGGAALLLLATAVLASWLPARRAGRIDPLETLRAD